MSYLRDAMIKRPVPLYVGVASVFALAALTPSPSPLALIPLLATLQLYVRTSPRSGGPGSRFGVMWLALSFSASLAHLAPSWDALSTPILSFIFLFILSSLSSAAALAAVSLDVKICQRLHSPWSELTFFPLVWTGTWYLVSHVSPVGRLLTWRPTTGFDGYRWMIPLTGPLVIDWTIAAWATICSQAIGMWFIGEGIDIESAHDEPHIWDRIVEHAHDAVHRHPKEQSTSPTIQDLFILGGLLSLLAVPSYFVNDLPTALWPPSRVSALTVGCVLPPATKGHGTPPTLDDFIAESQKLNNAHVLLWPEGAVTFSSSFKRDIALKRIREAVRGPYIGVSFEEYAPLDDLGMHKIKRTGLALVSNNSEEVHLLYFKRALVPIAESFSLTPSSDPPTIYNLELGPPKGTQKPDWTPGPPFTRPIPLTASICLDFCPTLLFRSHRTRPALILGPARTWHASVGQTMWEHTRQRAEEVGSVVLWCDEGRAP